MEELPDRPPVGFEDLLRKKAGREPIVMVTAYDWPSAQAAEHAGVDLVLVGDTAAPTVLGYPGTEPVTLDEMLVLAGAVRRGLKTPLMIGDLPMGSYEVSDEEAVHSAVRYVKLGCEAVKLERAGAMSRSRIRAIVSAGIPVMGHVGVTPQTSASTGGFRAKGRTAEQARQLVTQAEALEAAGCFAVVLEAVAKEVAASITERLAVPVIGIGAGPETDGQVLVFNDLVGHYENPPRFVKRFAEVGARTQAAVARYAAEVRAGGFPAEEHSYSMDEASLAEFEAGV